MFRPYSFFDSFRVFLLFSGMFFFSFDVCSMHRRNAVSVIDPDAVEELRNDYEKGLLMSDERAGALGETTATCAGDKDSGLGVSECAEDESVFLDTASPKAAFSGVLGVSDEATGAVGDGTGGPASMAGSVVSEESAPGAATGRMRRASRKLESFVEPVGVVSESVALAAPYVGGSGAGSSGSEASSRWSYEPLLDEAGQRRVYGSLYVDPYVFGENVGGEIYERLQGDAKALIQCLSHCDDVITSGFKGLISRAHVSDKAMLKKHSLYWQGVRKTFLRAMPSLFIKDLDFGSMKDPFEEGVIFGMLYFHKYSEHMREHFVSFAQSCFLKIQENRDSDDLRALLFWVSCKISFTAAFYAYMPFKKSVNYFDLGRVDGKTVFHPALYTRLIGYCSGRVEHYAKSDDPKSVALLNYWRGFRVSLEEAYKLCSEAEA